MKLKLTLILLFLSTTFATQAQTQETAKETSPWTLRAGARTLVLSLKPTLEVAYRLPDKHWEVLFYGSSPLSHLSYSSLEVGARYYFNPEDQDWNYFAMARAGAYVFDGTSTVYNPDGSTGTFGGLQYNPDFSIGLGVDWNWNEHFGLTGGFYGGPTYFFFPELALKYTF